MTTKSKQQKEMTPAESIRVQLKQALERRRVKLKITKAEVGRRLTKDPKEVNRIFDETHPTQLGTLVEVAHTLGLKLEVRVR